MSTVKEHFTDPREFYGPLEDSRPLRAIPPEHLADRAEMVARAILNGQCSPFLLPELPIEVKADEGIERVYIHETALSNLAKTSFEAAIAVSLGMASLRAWRVLDHRLHDAIKTQDVPAQTALTLLDATFVAADRQKYALEGLFRRIAYRSRNDGTDGGYVRMADRNTELFTNCWDEDHYTQPFTLKAYELTSKEGESFDTFNPKVESGQGLPGLRVVHGTDVTGLPGPDKNPEWQPDLLVVPRAPLTRAAEARFLRDFSLDALSRRILTTEQAALIEKRVRKVYVSDILGSLVTVRQIMARENEGKDGNSIQTGDRDRVLADLNTIRQMLLHGDGNGQKGMLARIKEISDLLDSLNTASEAITQGHQDNTRTQAKLDEIEALFEQRMSDPTFGHRHKRGSVTPRLLSESALAEYLGPHRWAKGAVVINKSPKRSRGNDQDLTVIG